MGAMGGDANSMLLLLVRERVLFGRRPKIQRTLHRCRRVNSAAASAAVTLLHTEEGLCYVPLPPPPPLLLLPHCPCMAVMSWQ